MQLQNLESTAGEYFNNFWNGEGPFYKSISKPKVIKEIDIFVYIKIEVIVHPKKTTNDKVQERLIHKR